MEQFKQNTALQELEQLRSTYNRLLDEQKSRTKEVERALEKERELRMRDTVQIEQIIAQKLQQQESRLREKYDQMQIALQQREAIVHRMEGDVAEQLEQVSKKREMMEEDMQTRFATLSDEHQRRITDEQHLWASKQRDLVEIENALELEAVRQREEIERELTERYRKLQEDALAREKEREVEKSAFCKGIEEKYDQAKQQLEQELSRAEELLEKSLIAKHNQLNEELIKRDREREQEKVSFKSAQERRFEELVKTLKADIENELSTRTQKLEREYTDKTRALEADMEQQRIALERRTEERLEQGRDRERRLDATISRFEMQLRQKYEQALQEDAEELWLQKRKLEDTERLLQDKLQKRLEEVKVKEASIEGSLGRYEAKIKENLQKAFDEEMASVKEQRRALDEAERELVALKDKLEAESERKISASEREIEQEYSTKYSTLKTQLEKQNAKRRDELEAHYVALQLEAERDLSTRKEELERDMAARLRGLTEEIDARDREREAAKLSYKRFLDEERDKDRARTEKELSLRKDAYDKEFAEILLKTQQDAAKKEQDRQKEMESFKKDFFLHMEALRTQLEAEFVAKREKIETELKLQQQKIRDEMLLRDRERDEEKMEYKLEIDRKYDQHLMEMREYESRVEREKVAFEATVQQKHAQEKRATLEQAQKTIDDARLKIESETKELLEKANKELDTRVKAELIRQEDFRKLQATAEQNSKKILEDLKAVLASERERCTAMAAQLEETRNALSEFSALAARKEDELKVKWAQQMSQLKNDMNTEIIEKERRILELSEKLSSQEREANIWREKIARETDVDVRAKYDTMRQQFEAAFLDELNESRQTREEFYKKKEQEIYEQRQHMLAEVQTYRGRVAIEISELRRKDEKELVDKHQKMMETDTQTLQEERDDFENRKRVFQQDYQRLMEEHRQKSDAEARRRQELHRKELEERRQQEFLLAKMKDDLEKEFLERRQRLHDEFSAREKEKDEEVAHLKRESEEAVLQQQRTTEIEATKRRQELEAELLSKHSKSQDLILEQDRAREAETLSFKLQLEEKYEQRLSLLREQEKQDEKDKILYETKLREKYQQERDADAKIQAENMSKIRAQLSAMEEHHKLLLSDLNALRATEVVVDAEHHRSTEELKSKYERALSDAKNQANRDIMVRETLLAELREQISAHNRENEIWRERIKREIETELNIQYINKKKEFEVRMEEDTKLILQRQDELLEERRASLHKEEQEQADRIQKLRQAHETEHLKKLEHIEKLLLARSEQLEDEFLQRKAEVEQDKLEYKRTMESRNIEFQHARESELSLRKEEVAKEFERRQKTMATELEERFKSRTAELEVQRAELQRRFDDMVATQAKELSAQRDTMEREVISRMQSLREQLLEREAERDREKLNERLELEQQYEQKLLAIQAQEMQVEHARASYEADLRKKYEALRERCEQELETQKHQIESYEKELYNNFQKMVDQHQDQLESETRERAKKIRADQEMRKNLEFEFSKTKEDFEKKTLESQQALQEELLARDRARDTEVGQLKISLQKEYEDKTRKLREHEASLDREKAEYEAAIREKHRRTADTENESLLEQKRKLDLYEKELHSSFRKMVTDYQQQLDIESEARAAETRDFLQKLAAQEVMRRESLLASISNNEAELKSRVQAMSHKMAILEDELRAKSGEIDTLSAALMDQRAEEQVRHGEMQTVYSKELSSIRMQKAAEVSDRDQRILALSEKVASLEREATLLAERVQGEIEAKLMEKYEGIQKDFEKRLLQDTRRVQDMQSELLKKREDNVLRQEKDLAAQGHDLRMKLELEFNQKQVEMSKELGEKYQALQREILESDRARELEKEKYKMDLVQHDHEQRRRFELDTLKARQHFESEQSNKYRTMEESLLEREKQRAQEVERQKRELSLERETNIREVKEAQFQVASARTSLEAEMRVKLEELREKDSLEMAEQKHTMEVREQDMLEKVQRAIDAYQQQIEIESKDRSRRAQLDLEERKRLEFELAQKRDEFERDFLARQQLLQDELLSRERERELERAKFKSETNSQYEQKLANLRELQSKLQQDHAKYESELRERYENANSKHLSALENHKAQLRQYERQLREQFDRLVTENSLRTDTHLADVASKQAKSAEDLITAELSRRVTAQQNIARYEAEMYAGLEKVRSSMSSMEELQIENVALIASLRAQLAEDRAAYVVKEEHSAEKELFSTKSTLQKELSDRHQRIIELERTLSIHERESVLWKEKTRNELEAEVRKHYEKLSHSFEERVKDQIQNHHAQQLELFKEREQHLLDLESEMFSRVQKAREQQEIDIGQKAMSLESELGLRHQNLVQEMLERDRQREEEKAEYKRLIDNRLEEQDRALRSVQAETEKERIAFEKGVREKSEKFITTIRTQLDEERLILLEEDTTRNSKLQSTMLDLNKQLSELSRQKADLDRQLAAHTVLEADIELRKDELNANFAARASKLQQEAAMRERERLYEVEAQRREIDKKLEEGLDLLRHKEEQIAASQREYLALVAERYEAAAQKDKELFRSQQNRLEEYEKHLISKFMLVLDEYRARVEADAEISFTKRHKVVDSVIGEEIMRVEKIKGEQRAFDDYVNAAVERVSIELDTLEQQNKKMLDEMLAIKVENAQLSAECQRKLDEKHVEAEKFMSQLRSQNHEEVAEKQREIIALREQLASHDREASIWRQRARSELEDELKCAYEALYKETEKRTVDENNASRKKQLEKDLKERMEFEADVRAYYEAMVIETENNMRAKFNTLLMESEEAARKQRAELDNRHKTELETYTAARLQLEETHTVARKAFENEIRDRYENVLAEYRLHIDKLLKEKDQTSIEKWRVDEKDLTQRTKYEEEIRTKYSQLMERQAKDFETSRAEILALYTKELQRRDQLLTEHSASSDEARRVFEAEIREKYLSLIEQHYAAQQKEQLTAASREMAELERRASLEDEKSKMLEVVEKRFHEQTKEKYDALIRELEGSWRAEFAAREKQMEARFRSHYESLLSAKDEQLQLSLSFSENTDRAERDRWVSALEELKNKHVGLLNSLEEKARAKYEAMLGEYERLYQQQLQHYEEYHIQQYLSLEHNRRLQQRKVAKLRIAFAKWKFDYQAHMQGKYEGLVSDLQTRYLQEVEGRVKDQAAHKETIVLSQLGEFIKPPRGNISNNPVAVAYSLSPDVVAAVAASTLKNPDKQQQLASLKATTQKLWEALETESSEISHFLNKVHASAADSDALLRLYTAEAARLNARLPIMQAVSRREFLKYRLEGLSKFPDPRSAEDRTRLIPELTTITATLATALPSYELQYKESFVYRGVVYADVMVKDAPEIAKYRKV